MAADIGIVLIEIVRRPVVEPQRLAVVIGDFGFANHFLDSEFRRVNLRIFLGLDEVCCHILSPAYSGLRFVGGWPEICGNHGLFRARGTRSL